MVGRQMTPEDFPEKGNRPYMLGFDGHACDKSIQMDRADWLQECISRGYIDSRSETPGFLTIRQFCIERGALKCADLLGRLGWPLERQQQ